MPIPITISTIYKVTEEIQTSPNTIHKRVMYFGSKELADEFMDNLKRFQEPTTIYAIEPITLYSTPEDSNAI